MSSSIPTTNMKSTTPIWLSRLSVPIEAGGKRKAIVCGESKPSTDGPNTIPATISPITGGWPILRKSAANSLAATMITIICSSKMLSGLLRFSCRTLPRYV